MPNPLVFLNDPATAAAQLQALLNPGNKAVFLILGDTPQHHELAAAALPKAQEWRFVVQVTDPAAVSAALAALTITAEPPVADQNTWFAICINFSNNIIEIYANDDTDNITPCFLLASAHTE